MQRSCCICSFYKNSKLDYKEGMYYQWYKQKDKIMALPKTMKRCKGAGRPPLLGELEEILLDRIVEMSTSKMKVSRSLLLASSMAVEYNFIEFKASSTWCTLEIISIKHNLKTKIKNISYLI